MSSQYGERDIEEQGEYYTRHISAMTSEKLRGKSDIAAELAHRDIEIESLKASLGKLIEDMWCIAEPVMHVWAGNTRIRKFNAAIEAAKEKIHGH